MNRLKLSNPQIKLEVIEVQFPKSCGLDTFRTLDLTSRGDEFVNQWLETHSYLWNDKAAPHNFQHIIRGTALESGGLIVNEHYFSPDAFDMATKIIVPPN